MELIHSTHKLCAGIIVNPNIEGYEHALPAESITQYHQVIEAAASRPEDAVPMLDLFVEQHINNAYALCFAIDTYEFLKQEEKALALLERTRALFPDELLVRAHYATHLMHTGNFESIPSVFDNKDSLADLYPAQTTITLRALLDWTYVFGSYYAYIKDFEKARTYVAVLHEVCPDHPVEHNLAEIITGVQKLVDPASIPARDESHIIQAKHEFCSKIRINTDIATFFDAIPQESADLVKKIMKCAGEKSPEAIKPTEELIARHPWHAAVAALAASVYQRLGQTETAGAILRKAHTRDSENLLLRSMSARWFTSNGQQQLVPELFKKSLSLNGLYPKDTELTLLEVSEWAYTLGSYFIMGNNTKLGIVYAQILQEICPELPVSEALAEMVCKATGCTCEKPVEPKPRILERRSCC